MRKILFLTQLKRWDDETLLILRLFVGAFLIWGVADDIFGTSRMVEFESFLQQHGFLKSSFWALVSIWAQFVVGVAFVLGCFTRWAGVICAVNFAIVLLTMDSHMGIRASFPFAVLIAIGVYLATHGAGRISVDQKLFNQV